MKENNLLKKVLKNKIPLVASTILMLAAFTNDRTQASEVVVKTSNNSNSNVQKVDNAEKPNIVYIVIDDAGYSDIGSYGSEIKTPNIDKLAKSGIRYSNSHVSPLSSPTRASLLTGRNSHSVGMGLVANFDLDEPSKQGRIIDNAGTIAEVLKEEGYNTYGVGKWHLAPSHEITAAGPYDNWPLNKGFDQYYGILEDSTDQYKPDLVIDNTFVEVPKDDSYHFSEAIVNQANRYVTNQASINPDKPFFLYLSFGAQHQPAQVSEEYKEMYEGVYDVGWDEIRQQRFERQIELGLFPEGTQLPKSDESVPQWSDLSPEEQEVFIEFQKNYAGFLTHADEQIGRFIQTLKNIGEYDDTLIVFLSDNGASSLGGATGSINHTLNYNYLDENINQIIESKELIGTSKTKAEYPLGWAQVSNTPFRAYKTNLLEGGIRTPLIVSYPKKIKNVNQISHNYSYITDVTATIYDYLDIEVPKSINGVKQMDIHGVSFANTFKNVNSQKTRTTQYYEVFGTRAIYHDGWKAISIHKPKDDYENDTWMLFNVAEDPTEIHDVAQENKAKLKQLISLFDREAKKYGLYPLSDTRAEGFSYIAKGSNRDKNSFTYYQGADRVSEGASPMLLNQSYEIMIPVTRDSKDIEGVLAALGSYESGYTIFVKDNKLYYEYNRGDGVYRIESRKAMPAGKSVVKLKFNKTGNYQGTATLLIDEEPVGEVFIKQTHLYKMSFEGFEVGKDTGYPVSELYKDKEHFEFEGSIEKVQIDILQ